MRLIRNPWRGKKGYFCFGCCPDNMAGVAMTFYADGDDVVSVWRPRSEYQGWIDTLHGGIQAVLLDEACAWAVMYHCQTTGVTSHMETQYRKPVMTTDTHVVLRARVTEMRRNLATVEATLSDSTGQLCSRCMCTYFTFTKEKADEMGFQPCMTEGEDVTLEQLVAAR